MAPHFFQFLIDLKNPLSNEKGNSITTQVMLDAEKGEAKIGFAAVDSLTFKDLSIEPCPTFPPQVSNQPFLNINHLVG